MAVRVVLVFPALNKKSTISRAFLREWMGVEPTAAYSVQPATGFEDQGNHRVTTTPLGSIIEPEYIKRIDCAKSPILTPMACSER